MNLSILLNEMLKSPKKVFGREEQGKTTITEIKSLEELYNAFGVVMPPMPKPSKANFFHKPKVKIPETAKELQAIIGPNGSIYVWETKNPEITGSSVAEKIEGSQTHNYFFKRLFAKYIEVSIKVVENNFVISIDREQMGIIVSGLHPEDCRLLTNTIENFRRKNPFIKEDPTFTNVAEYVIKTGLAAKSTTPEFVNRKSDVYVPTKKEREQGRKFNQWFNNR